MTKGRGFIRIGEMEPLLDLALTDLAAWHTTLMLPDSYEIERIEPVERAWDVFVLSSSIPVDTDHITQTEVQPHYAIQYPEGTPFLQRIEIHQWNGEQWQLVAMTDVQVTDNRDEFSGTLDGIFGTCGKCGSRRCSCGGCVKCGTCRC